MLVYLSEESYYNETGDLKSLCTFLFVPKTNKLMLKSPASIIFFRFLPFFENISLKWVSHCFLSQVACRWYWEYIFRFSSWYFSRKRLNCITVYSQFRSSLSLKLRLSCTKMNLVWCMTIVIRNRRRRAKPFPMTMVWPYNLKVENSNFCWKMFSLPMSLKNTILKFELNCRIKFFERFKILIHTSRRATRGRGKASPALFWKSKKVPWFWEKMPCVHP